MKQYAIISFAMFSTPKKKWVILTTIHLLLLYAKKKKPLKNQEKRKKLNQGIRLFENHSFLM